MRNSARLATAITLAGALGGCVISSGHKRGPNGLPMYYLDGMTAGAALRKAEKYCPNGYKTIGTPKQTSALDFIMVIECNPPGNAPVPVATAAASVPAGVLVALPDIDISSHCRSVKEATGSSFAQVSCLELEPPAKAWLQRHYTTSAIALYCGRIAETSKSYFTTQACVEVEEKSQEKLQGETLAPTPSQSNSTWWDKQKAASGSP